jgi:hypothetical protein
MSRIVSRMSSIGDVFTWILENRYGAELAFTKQVIYFWFHIFLSSSKPGVLYVTHRGGSYTTTATKRIN